MVTKKKPQKEYLTCISCNKSKEKHSNYYNTANKLYENIGKLPICKSCLKESIDYDNMETVYAVLQQFDIVFDIGHWESAEASKMDTFGRYMSMANSLDNLKGRGFKDSIFDKLASKKINQLSVEASDSENRFDTQIAISPEELESLKEIYGHGYPDEEYILFEKKFRKLKPSFQLPTTMHEEYLREYCVNKVKETIAKAKGEFKEAKEWAAMAKESAEAGKLKPSQMSKSDLSKGLDGFGQLARMVEQHQDIIPLLPKFTQQPKDKVDITLWLYINYIRDLEGLPEADYKDIYQFYEVRREDYESRELDSSPEMQVEEDDE